MTSSFNEQVVIVSGAGRGLGAAIAAAFAREDASVIVNWRHSADGRVGASEGLRLIAIDYSGASHGNYVRL